MNTNKNIIQRIQSGKPLLIDGALGSLLIDRGLPAGQAPEAWVLERPEVLQEVHRQYRDAGADVITTCTFGGNRFRLQKASLDDRLVEINQRAVEIAREAVADDRAFIAGDMGPTGEFFQPVGSLTDETAREAFEEQAAALADAGIDIFLHETHYDLKEAVIALEACREVAPDVPAAVTLTFNNTPKGFFTVMGNPALESLLNIREKGALLVGSNCTLEAEGMLELASYLSENIETPLLFQANAGSPEITPDGVIYPQTPEEFAGFANDMLKLGIRAVGGCCGTTADHIRELRRTIDSFISGD